MIDEQEVMVVLMGSMKHGRYALVGLLDRQVTNKKLSKKMFHLDSL